MKPTPRALALVAVLALPVAAVVVTLLLRGSDAPVNESPVVRIGGADGSRSELPSLPSRDSTPPPSSTTTDGHGTGPDGPERPPSRPGSEPQPTRDVVPPPPPVDDDDDDDDDDGGDDDDGDDD
ncbi:MULTISPECIES: hypothetical protein [Prauserella salsuginis group]|uniref:Small secreted hydrophilic protein n=2 Tax=Prauserella salsuginis group TaxID=2893672 RepID=A0A839XNR8_9PSEU|nr:MULTISPECIES: hypothetical protein [Prauserella salsuginis group]MBB3664391.1 hypothetical protein [Prauserella sediminis]MCR3721842.1 hypothetical protein [Prauserella flava]MCR3734533.1 hypothetical protein [Prauserella salsuginis]